MQEGEQLAVVLALDVEIVETSLTRGEPVGFDHRGGGRWQRQQHRARSGAKEVRVPLLVHGVPQIEPPKQTIARQLRGPRQIAPTICFRFGKTQQLAGAPLRVAPDQPMDRVEQPIDARRVDSRRPRRFAAQHQPLTRFPGQTSRGTHPHRRPSFATIGGGFPPDLKRTTYVRPELGYKGFRHEQSVPVSGENRNRRNRREYLNGSRRTTKGKTLMKLAENLLAAAVSGIVLGAAGGCQQSSAPPASSPGSSSAATTAAPGAKHACKGQNQCKGQGGCKVEGKNGCKGQNACKRQGGCEM